VILNSAAKKNTAGNSKRYTLVILLSMLLFACQFKHADYGTSFHIQCTVIDEATNAPISNVKVVFIDTGFDSAKSKKRVPNPLGESDSEGRVDTIFHYWWGREEGLFMGKAEETFDLEFSKESYSSNRLSLRAVAFSKEGDTLKVQLGKVSLRRSTK
jgi:hypothetical protein